MGISAWEDGMRLRAHAKRRNARRSSSVISSSTSHRCWMCRASGCTPSKSVHCLSSSTSTLREPAKSRSSSRGVKMPIISTGSTPASPLRSARSATSPSRSRRSSASATKRRHVAAVTGASSPPGTSATREPSLRWVEKLRSAHSGGSQPPSSRARPARSTSVSTRAARASTSSRCARDTGMAQRGRHTRSGTSSASCSPWRAAVPRSLPANCASSCVSGDVAAGLGTNLSWFMPTPEARLGHGTRSGRRQRSPGRRAADMGSAWSSSTTCSKTAR
mmetsp:Transcript_7233/g.24398  ORF Transcript_7233/g.24398 Transcript_7233/m.24398 type:complete len:276 (+) Transcript_7233:350-1177(+)